MRVVGFQKPPSLARSNLLASGWPSAFTCRVGRTPESSTRTQLGLPRMQSSRVLLDEGKRGAATRRTEGDAGPGIHRWRAGTAFACCMLLMGFMMRGAPAGAEDELAQYAKNGNTVGVDPKCFVEKCSLPTKACLHNADCLKGISCLSKCKGEGTCSTACFAKYGSSVLDDFLHCAVEKQDCVHVPRDQSRATWKDPDAAGASKMPVSTFKIGSLEGQWYKVMGMDARYDCFDCQVNRFTRKEGVDDVVMADVQFRMPRPRSPGFWENHITEELISDGPGGRRSMHSVGRMFGLTFWENWYVIGENEPDDKLPPFKFVYYTGHTLQGNYEGAFVYARSPELPVELEDQVSRVARSNGLDPNKFCKIRNACFLDPPQPPLNEPAGMALAEPAPVWRRWMPSLLGQKVLQLSSLVTQELSDWFEDPSTTSDWLLRQQERVVLRDSTMLPSSGAQQPPASPQTPSPTSILARQNDIYD